MRIVECFAAVALIAVLAGCPGRVIKGQVFNTNEEALPGVVVQVAGTEHQALSNALGAYTVHYTEPGRLELLFSKTGYTPGRLELQADSPEPIQVNPMRLWRLPQNKGVYLYKDGQYLGTKPVECEEFISQDKGVLYGSAKFKSDQPGVLKTIETNPALLCYNMPKQDVELHRIASSSIEQAGERKGEPLDVWTPTAAFPVSLEAIDQPEAILQQVHLFSPLEPGVYAIHWGALEGSRELDSRMFVFIVQTPEEAAKPPEVKPEEPETELKTIAPEDIEMPAGAEGVD